MRPCIEITMAKHSLAAAALLLLAGCALDRGVISNAAGNVADVRDGYIAAGYACTPYGRNQILCDRRSCTTCPSPARSKPLVLITYDPNNFEVTKIE